MKKVNTVMLYRQEQTAQTKARSPSKSLLTSMQSRTDKKRVMEGVNTGDNCLEGAGARTEGRNSKIPWQRHMPDCV